MKLAALLLFAGLLRAQPPQQPVPQDPDKARLEGHVFNAVTGEPIRKTKLTLRMNVAALQTTRQQQGPITSYIATSDAAGKFEFPNVDPGDYQLTATREGYATVRLGNGTNGPKKPDPILLNQSDRKAGLVVKLTPYGAIAGVLVDDDGDPVRSLTVAAMTWNYTSNGRELKEVRTASSNDLGEYRIYDIPPGKYYLKINPPRLQLRGGDPDNSFSPVFYPNSIQASGAVVQEIAPGQQLRGVNFNLHNGRFATIRGKVIAPPGAHAGAGLLIATEGGTSSTSGGVDDKDGKFEFHGVPPGTIFVTGDYSLNSQRYDTMLQVEVGTSDINGLELRPVPPMDVTGSLRIDGTTDTQVRQLGISLDGPSAGHNVGTNATIREDGSLLFHNIAAGLYRLALNRLQSLYIKSIQWGTQDITDLPLDLLGGAPPRTELAIVLGADAGQMEGIVTGDQSEPADSAIVTLVPTGAHHSRPFYKIATADAAGHFTISGIAPGTYKLWAWDKVDRNAVMYDPDFLRPYEGAAQSLSVASSDKKVIELKLTLNREQ
jgi:hypothetical protein